MPKGQRRRKRTDPTEGLNRLDPKPWPGLEDNSKLHSPEDNLIAQRRCRQLIRSMRNLEFAEGTSQPDKKAGWDHFPNSLGYLCLALHHGLLPYRIGNTGYALW